MDEKIEVPGSATTPDPGANPAGAGSSEGTPEQVREGVIEVLRSVFDPEIPVNIYELGLVYEVAVDEARKVQIRMTLTSPMCPVAESLPVEVESKARSVAGVSGVELALVWEPPWQPSMMSEAARLELGM